MEKRQGRDLDSAHLVLDLVCLGLSRVDSLLPLLFCLVDNAGALVLCLFNAFGSPVLDSRECLTSPLLELLERGLRCRAGCRDTGGGRRGDDANTRNSDGVEGALAVGVCRSQTETGAKPYGESSSYTDPGKKEEIKDKAQSEQTATATQRKSQSRDLRRKRRTERTTPAENPIPVLTTALLMQRSVCRHRYKKA